MSADTLKSTPPILEIPIADEEDDIGLTPLTRPGTPLIIGTKPRLRPQEILVPSPISRGDSQTPWLQSPSSPDLLDRNILPPRTLTRSKTVSGPVVTAATTKPEEIMIEDLDFEPEKLVRLRRWILTVALGGFALKLKNQVMNFVVVDFDLELGPTVVSVFPSLTLSHVERENMYVRSPGFSTPQV